LFILKFGFDTPQLAAADFKPSKSMILNGPEKISIFSWRQKLLVAKRKISREYPAACYEGSEILDNFFILERQ